MAEAYICSLSKVQRHAEICKEINNLYERKNHDYGDSFHQTFVEEGMAMARIRLGDKFSRFKTLSRSGEMTLNDYQKAAERTSGNLTSWDKVRNGCYGLNGEAGECIDILKKTEFQGHDFDPMKMVDELGDVLWYVAQLATGLGVTLEYVAQHNVDKLLARYPDGFDSEKSIHRKEYENA